jgi:hypothetical protein
VSVTLKVTDNQNGTGATATISGSAGGTNTVYVQPYSAGQVGGAFYQAGTRTGDGTVLLAIAPGSYYWAYVLTSGNAAPSNFVSFPVTLNADSVWWRCCLATQAVIQGLKLTGVPPLKGIPSNQVYLQKSFDHAGLVFPCILVMPPMQGEKMAWATNVMEDLSYPVFVGVLDRSPSAYEKDLQQQLNWRQQLQRAFRGQRLANVPEIWKTEINFNPPVDPKHPMYVLLVNSFLCWFVSREIRGT